MLSDDVVTRLRPHLEPVELQQGEHLFATDQQLRHVFFFEGRLSSEIAGGNGDKTIEVGCIGLEGFFECSSDPRCRQHTAFRLHAMWRTRLEDRSRCTSCGDG